MAIIRALDEAGLRVRALTGGEQAAACWKLLDLVREQGFRHIGQPELATAWREGRPPRGVAKCRLQAAPTVQQAEPVVS